MTEPQALALCALLLLAFFAGYLAGKEPADV